VLLQKAVIARQPFLIDAHLLKLRMGKCNFLEKKEIINSILTLSLNCILIFPFLSCSGNKESSLSNMDVSDTTSLKVHLNYSLIGELDSTENGILKLLESYLNSRDTVLYYDSPLWSSQDKAGHLYPDIEMHYICYRTKKFTKYQPSILSIQKIDTSYVIKILFSNFKKHPDVLSVYNIVASKEFGEYVFHTYSDFFKKKWIERKKSTVRYYFDDSHAFDEQLAKKFDEFNVNVAKKFDMEPLNLRYFVFENTELRYRFKGYDFDVRMFETIQQSAEVDLYNNIIYASNGTEYYPHEAVHFYTFKKFGGSLSRFFDEGLATLLGGNINATFKEDVLMMKEFVSTHPNFDFSNLTDIRENFGKTNFEYTVAAILCNAILVKGGSSALDRALNCGNKPESIYAVLKSELNLDRQNVNSFILNQLDASN
jgi:hypothetical protein